MVIEARKSTHLEFGYQVISIFVFVNLIKYRIYNPGNPIRNAADESYSKLDFRLKLAFNKVKGFGRLKIKLCFLYVLQTKARLLHHFNLLFFSIPLNQEFYDVLK